METQNQIKRTISKPEAINQIKKLIDENPAMNNSVDSLKSLAEKLNQMVSQFSIT